MVPVTQTNASQFKGQIKHSVGMDCSVWPLMNNSGTWRRQCKSEVLNPALGEVSKRLSLTPVQNMFQDGLTEFVNCPIDGSVLQA